MNIIQKISPYKALHFIGCYALCLTTWNLGLNLWAGVAIVAVIAIGWQILDAANQTYHWKIPALNPAGGDARGLWIDALAILSACLLNFMVGP